MSPRPASPDQIRRAERRTDLRTAVVTYLACVLLLAVDLTGMTTNSPFAAENRWWHLLPLTAGCALMLVKRRRPIFAVTGGAALIGVDLMIGGSLGPVVVFVDLLYAAGLYSTPRARRGVTIAAGAIVAATMVAVGVASSGDLRAIVASALQSLALLVMPLWWAADVRQKSDLAALAFEREALAQAHAADLTRIADLRRRDAVQAERRAMARDLHDVVAGHVSAVAIRTGAALTRPDIAVRERETLDFVRSSSLTTLEEMRTMILLLRGDAQDEPLASPGRLEDLADLVDSHRSGGLDLTVSRGLDGARLPIAVDQAAFRIAQEALTNAAKHGGAGPVSVEIGASSTALILTVTNALPTDAAPTAQTVASGQSATKAQSVASGQTLTSAGIGLATMRERAEGLGGAFHAGPDGRLWRVQASLPLHTALPLQTAFPLAFSLPQSLPLPLPLQDRS